MATFPGFEEMMLPILEFLRDEKEHPLSEIYDYVAAKLNITDEQLEMRLPSGKQRILDNRAQWASTYLMNAKLVSRVSHGTYKITNRGKEVLASKPAFIDRRFLKQYPEFIEFITAHLHKKKEEIATQDIEEELVERQSPRETLENSINSLNRTLTDDLLERVKKVSPISFENLVIDLLLAMGYGGSREEAARKIVQSQDGGIDGVIKEDRLGFDVVCVQAKRWENSVGRPLVQAFVGSLEGQRARKGVFITTSSFSKQALDYVNNIEKKVILIDGEQLAELMIENNVGVTTEQVYAVKRIDLDYFEEYL